MTDLTQQRNAQIIAPLACAQDSARQLGSGAEHKTAKEPAESENNNLFEQTSSKPSKIVQIPKQVRNDDFSLVNENNNKTSCHPGGFTLCRENVTKCHIFERWRRVNECEPSPVSEQIEHTKTECLYAKLCEREVNPRQLVSGSVPIAQLSNRLSQERNKNINSYFMFISFLFLRRKRKEMNQRKEKGRQLKNTVNF